MKIRMKSVFYTLLFWCDFLLLYVMSVDDKSCDSRCYNYNKMDKIDKDKPECGVWAHSDNMKHVGGVYILDSGYANLTCTITSLPKPATVKWHFQADGDDEFRPVVCDSMRTVSECKFNALGEHKVTSICLVKIADLDQSGTYKCSGIIANKPAASSGQAHIRVHGVSNFTLVDNGTLPYGKAAEIRIRVCAYPKPDIVWIHDTHGISISSGQSAGNFTALPLHQMLEHRGEYEPVRTHKYCYIGRLVIAKVNSTDRYFTVMASNSVGTRHLKLKMSLAGVPAVRKSATKSAVLDKKILYSTFLFTMLFSTYFCHKLRL